MFSVMPASLQFVHLRATLINRLRQIVQRGGRSEERCGLVEGEVGTGAEDCGKHKARAGGLFG